MASCLSVNVAEYFYSVPFFILLTICSIFVIFADSIIHLVGDPYDITDILIWIIVPLIMILFIVEYLMICRLFSCKVFNQTTCDCIYVVSILSLIIELTRITPKMQSFSYCTLDEHNTEYYIQNSLYWTHKLFDSFIDFIVYIRVVHAILRAVLYYIYGKEYRQTHRHKSSRKTLRTKYAKNGYEPTAADDVDHSTSASSSNTTPDHEPEPIQPTIMDDADNTAPLPSNEEHPVMATRHSVELFHTNNNEYIHDITPKQEHLSKRFKLKLDLNPISPNHTNTRTPIPFDTADVVKYIQSADNSPMDATQRKDLNLNINNMLSPPQIEIDPSDVDTQSIERIELPTFHPMQYKQEAEDDEEEQEQEDEEEAQHDEMIKNNTERESDDIMIENQKGDNWGIFPMFASKVGLIVNLCVCLISLFDHPYLFMVGICIFGGSFCILMYISAHHFVQFIRSFLDSHSDIFNKQLLPDDTSVQKDAVKAPKTSNGDIYREDGRRTSDAVLNPFHGEAQLSKHITSIVLNPTINNPSAMHEATTLIFNPWTESDIEDESTAFPIPSSNDMEFRTGQDEIKKIVRNMLSQTHANNTHAFAYDTRCKLESILSILQDIDVMDKGNIEEKIELDEEIGVEEKRWLNQTLLSKHSMVEAMSGITPHFVFNAAISVTNVSNNEDKEALITPLASHDINLSHTISPQNVVGSIKEGETDEKYQVDTCITDIIEEKMNRNDMLHLRETLLSLSSDLDKITAKIMNLDLSFDTMELNRLTGNPLVHSSICIFLKYDFGNELDINFKKFYHFIRYIEESYGCNNPYHNKMHATEVMVATMAFIDCLDRTVRAMISVKQIFCAFIAAIIHDVDHPGNNNSFEINSESDNSILYSDESVLEFHHLHFAFSALKREENQFMQRWDRQSRKEFRKQCIYSVLATDLSKHFGTIAHIKQLKIIKDSDLEYVFKSIIKMSDLSHVTKPLMQHKLWTKLITQEFHNQGDKETRHGLEVSPLCNKQNTKIAKGQVGFIKHVVSPLYQAAQRFFKKNSTFDQAIVTQLNSNRKYWENEAKKQETPKEIPKGINMNNSNITARSVPGKRQRCKPPQRRPQSATFARKIAILTNLENTPPPILPSSVRMIGASKMQSSFSNKTPTKYFFSPNSSTKSKDIGKGAKEVTFKFESYSKIKGKKRTRSSSNPSNIIPVFPDSDILEKAQPNVTNSHNKLTDLVNDLVNVTPQSILRLGSKGNRSVRSSTPKHVIRTRNHYNRMAISPNVLSYNKKKNKKKKDKNDRDLLRTKSSDNVPITKNDSVSITNSLHMLSPKQFISPYSISHDVQPQQQQHHAITIHEEKSSSDNQQHFKFEGIVNENK